MTDQHTIMGRGPAAAPGAGEDAELTAAPGTRSRRAILAAGLGAATATIASAVAPHGTFAANGQAVTVGTVFSGTSPTGLTLTGAGPALSITANTSSAKAVYAEAFYGDAVRAETRTGVAINAVAWGEGLATGTAVSAYGNLGTGLVARGVDGINVSAQEDGTGIALSASHGQGTSIRTQSVDGMALYASSSNGNAVFGTSSNADGVLGSSLKGTGVHAQSDMGTALKVDGKARFNRSGRTLIKKGHSYVDVTVAGGVGSTALCFADLTLLRTGTWVAAVRPNFPTGKMRIYLNKAISTDTYLSWIVLG